MTLAFLMFAVPFAIAICIVAALWSTRRRVSGDEQPPIYRAGGVNTFLPPDYRERVEKSLRELGIHVEKKP